MKLIPDFFRRLERQPAATEQTLADTAISSVNDYLLPLFKLHQKKELIEVRSPHSPHQFQSLILAVDMERQEIWLDELFPRLVDHQLQAGDNIRVQRYHQGRVVFFETEIVARRLHNGEPVVIARMPDAVYDQQRRQFPRVSVVKDSGVSFHATSANKTPIFATVRDLSRCGIKFVIAGDFTQQLHREQLLKDCELRLGDEGSIACSVQLKALRFKRSLDNPEQRQQFADELLDTFAADATDDAA